MPDMSDICRKIRIPAEISQSAGHRKNYTRHPPFLELKYKNHAALKNSFSKLGRLGLGALSHTQISKEVQVVLCKNCLMLAYPCLSNHQPTRLKIQKQLTMLRRQRKMAQERAKPGDHDRREKEEHDKHVATRHTTEISNWPRTGTVQAVSWSGGGTKKGRGPTRASTYLQSLWHTVCRTQGHWIVILVSQQNWRNRSLPPMASLPLKEGQIVPQLAKLIFADRYTLLLPDTDSTNPCLNFFPSKFA